jgi:hypothetical protein
MKNIPIKFWLTLLVFIGCLLALIPTFFVPGYVALQSSVTRIYPKSTIELVKVDQIFVYQLPAESRGFPFGLHCSPLFPSLLDNDQSPVLARTVYKAGVIGVLPDPIHNILLSPNSRVSVQFKGHCYVDLGTLGGFRLFRYSISQETFQVGESHYSQEELIQLIRDYIDEQYPQEFYELIP